MSKHTCQAAILNCLDFRFVAEVCAFMEREGLMGDCDVISVDGGIKDLVTPKEETDQQYILKQLDTSRRLHNVAKIYLVAHLDCSAYGGHEPFSSVKDERRSHSEQLDLAAKLLITRYPGIEVEKLLANIDESGMVHIDRV